MIEKPEVFAEKDVLVKKDSIGKLLIFGTVFFIGIVILVSSINLGDNEISNIMKAHGGSMDTNIYDLFGAINNKIQSSWFNIVIIRRTWCTINYK